jgi:hypothetical protein
MTRTQGSSSKSISNLSMGLVESAFLLLIQHSLPVYRHNIMRERPPVAQGENVNAAAAIVMLITALDHHLCRLKYLRDVARHKPPLPYTPYFNWTFEEALSEKLKKLLIRRKESRLLTQLIELTVCRDSVVHPKFYTVTESWDSDLNLKSMKAKLPPSVTLKPKAIKHKMERKHVTKLLRIPLVPTWISYADAVICIAVLHRLLNLLEFRYGNPYAWLGGITAYEKQTKELFTKWNWHQSHPRELVDWVTAFFQSLSAQDQDKVRKAVGGHLAPYLKKKQLRLKSVGGSKRSLSEIFDHLQRTSKPDFLFKPPPHLLSKR